MVISSEYIMEQKELSIRSYPILLLPRIKSIRTQWIKYHLIIYKNNFGWERMLLFFLKRNLSGQEKIGHISRKERLSGIQTKK